MKIKIKISIAVLLLISGSLHAQSLRDALQFYVDTHPQVLSAQAQLSAAESEKRGEYTFLFPYKGNTKLDTSFSGDGPQVRGKISFYHTIFNSTRMNSIRKTEVLIRSAEAYEEWVRQLVMYDLFYKVLQTQKAYETYLLALNRRDLVAQANESSIRRFDLGALNRSDMDYSYSRLAGAEIDMTQAELEYKRHVLDLRSLLGETFPFEISSLNNLSFHKSSLDSDLPDRGELMGLRADFKQSVILLEVLDHDIFGARRNSVPNVGVEAGMYRLFSEIPEFRLSVDVDLPLASIAKDIHEKEGFLMEKEAAEQNLKDALREAEADLLKNRLTVEVYESSRQSYLDAVDYSKRAMNGINQEYELGFSSIYDLIDAQTNYFGMAVRLNQSRITLMTAELDYYFLSGGLNLDSFKFSP